MQKQLTRILPLQLVGEVLALSQTTLVSEHVTFSYILDRLIINFPTGCDYLVRAYPYISLDPTVHTADLPQGTPILSPLSPKPYLLGDNTNVDLDPDIVVDIRGTWIKLHLVNADIYPHHVSAIITLRELRPEE
jgi:hypothetical protein